MFIFVQEVERKCTLSLIRNIRSVDVTCPGRSRIKPSEVYAYRKMINLALLHFTTPPGG